jgi:hypothetical protein
MTCGDKAKSTKALQKSYKSMLFDYSLSTLANIFFRFAARLLLLD